MHAVSAGFLDAVRNGGERVQRAYVIDTANELTEVPITGFAITADRKAVARYAGSVSIAPGVSRDLVEPYGAKVRVMDGFRIGGTDELVPVGTMRIDDVTEDEAGALELECFGLEMTVKDAIFWQPRFIESSSALAEIATLLSVADAPVNVLTTRDAPVKAVIYERERWEAVDGSDKSMARAIAVEVYADTFGSFVIRDIPTLENPPVWTVDAGPAGVLVSYATKTSREGVYNAVVAVNNRVEQDNPVVRAVAYDSNPSSPTYFGGGFKQVSRIYESPLLDTNWHAQAAADALLAQSLGLARTVDFTHLPNPALEPGDVVELVLADGRREAHIFDRITHLSAGTQSGDTRTTGGVPWTPDPES